MQTKLKQPNAIRVQSPRTGVRVTWPLNREPFLKGRGIGRHMAEIVRLSQTLGKGKVNA